MRISDWSSDVCSSDLPDQGAREAMDIVLPALVVARRFEQAFHSAFKPLAFGTHQFDLSFDQRNRRTAAMLQFDRFEQVRMPREKVRMRLQIRDNLALVELRRGRLFVLRIQFGHSMFPSKTVSAGPVINTGCPSPAHSIVSCPPRTCTSTWADR